MSESRHANPLGDKLSDHRDDPPGVDPLGGDPLAGPGDPLADRGADPLRAAPADDDDDTIKVRKNRAAPAAQPVGAAISERFASWAATHVGTVRKHNEDSLVDRSDLSLWAVADGAGGHSRGDVASQSVKAALESLTGDMTPGEVLAEVRQRMADVNATLRASVQPPEICATTVVVLIARGEHYACLWAGDSRAYLLRDGVMTQVTRDHSLVQEMVDAGVLDAAEAERHPRANVLTRLIGADGPPPELDKITGRAALGDRFLLCSDGLFKALDAVTIGHLVGGSDPARLLIDAALKANARDNITALVVMPEPGQIEDGTLQIR
jgi:serine/threonine protein phosphatase Stp1